MRYGGSRFGQLLRLSSFSAQSRATTQPRCIYGPRDGHTKPLRWQRWSSQASRPAGNESAPARQPAEVIPPPSPTLPTRSWSTPLAKTIAQAIEVTGPIPIASYMRQCLTNPDGGYYTTTREDADQFGTAGDFITSPEISQIFGELVGIWFMTEWMAQGRPTQGVQFIEMGPGRGTLMSDILRTIGQFRTFAKSIQAVWLVEAGEGLRIKQKDLLCGTDAEMKEVTDHTGKNRWWEATSKQGIPVRWVEDIVLLPSKQESGEQTTPFIIAHEFFDALPIHAFESVAPKPEEAQQQDAKSQVLNEAGQRVPKPSRASKLPQWRELLVAPTKPKFSIATTAELARPSAKQPDPDFQLTLAQASTPSSLVIPERPRYRALKNRVSSRVEISPESSRYVQEFARRIGGAAQTQTPAGAALIIDYGPLETVPIDSLRAISKHKVISPFVYAGEADISADVDFVALAEAALQASPGVEVHGPVEQGAWLSQLGIQERAERLLKELEKKEGIDSDELQKKMTELGTGWKRLVEGGPRGMGKAYKVMTILPENGGRRRPVGFGGGVIG
ncbi:protoporphyrinogen oxidase [Exophiala viscosa]|uniref:Protein arginine methyltransferase NDUFAF7 n=1 Tax=Exophiala viscosa TaxID=2486360 RepID=A0AAN6E6M2_9EURO|nr:protoporphyrinogen oxidase [Exophiala viscosa]KAI1627309.1 protoporphyrinogen oxidase [Exophiala viscosa]